MKKQAILILLLAGYVLTCHAQDTLSVNKEKQKPKATYQVGAAKIVVWENKGKNNTTWKNFHVEKVYKKDDQWKSTNSFNQKELLELRAAIDKAISEESVKTK